MVSNGESAAAMKSSRPWWVEKRWLLILGAMLFLSYVGDVLVVGFFLTLALLGFMAGRAALAQARIMADTPTSTIRGASQGRVELKARIPVAEPLVAPLSKEKCCFWILIAEFQDRDGNRSDWKEVGKAWPGEEWLELDDGTGKCLLALPEAEIKGRTKVEHSFIGTGMEGLGKHFGKDVRAVMQPLAPKRIIEIRFDVDAEIYAIGLFQSLSSNNTPFDDDWARRALRSGAAVPGWARALAKAAIADGEAGRQVMMDKWRARMRVLEGIGPDAPLAGSATVHTLRKDDRKGMMFPLILSDKDERQVITKTRWSAFAAFVFMVVMLGVAVLILAENRPDLLQFLIGIFS